MDLIAFSKLVFVVLLAFFNTCHCSNEEFHESADMEFLDEKLLYNYFNFTVIVPHDHYKQQHYRLFPRPLGQIMKKYHVSEVHFSITRGIWRKNWARQPDSPAPVGAQIWAWFQENTVDVDRNWKGLLSSLSALFCASLDQISCDMTVRTKYSFPPEGVIQSSRKDISLMRYTSLVREHICTENLTPWIKLLPCYSNSGIASLVNSKSFHNSHYLSMGFHLKHVCDDKLCQRSSVKLKQDLTAVMEVKNDGSSDNLFSLKATLGQSLKPPCKLATSSTIKLKINPTIYTSPTDLDETGSHYLLDLHKKYSKNIILQKSVSSTRHSVSEQKTYPVITNHCFLSEEELSGRLVCLINNDHNTKISTSFLQIFPWFLYVRFHSLKIKDHNGSDVSIKMIDFVPGKFRKTSSVLEVLLTLMPHSTTTFSVEFKKGFLKWTEHPPDANHGFYISPSVITINEINGVAVDKMDQERLKIFSEAQLLSIPVPDFSMPYNVICFVSTVLAIGFGQLFYLSSKKFKYTTNPKRPIFVLYEGLKGSIKGFVEKLTFVIRRPVEVSKK